MWPQIQEVCLDLEVSGHLNYPSLCERALMLCPILCRGAGAGRFWGLHGRRANREDWRCGQKCHQGHGRRMAAGRAAGEEGHFPVKLCQSMLSHGELSLCVYIYMLTYLLNILSLSQYRKYLCIWWATARGNHEALEKVWHKNILLFLCCKYV